MMQLLLAGAPAGEQETKSGQVGRACVGLHTCYKTELDSVSLVKATALNMQQMSKFNEQMLAITSMSCQLHVINDITFMTGMHLTDINVIASICALNLQIKCWYLLFKAVA